MSRPLAITRAYIEAHPAAAAADISLLRDEEASMLLEAVPVAHATKLVGYASSWTSASVLPLLVPTTANAILRNVSFAKAAEILRLMPDTARRKLLATAPNKMKRDFEISLTYPDDTVGASMSIAVLAYQPDRLARDVVSELRDLTDTPGDLIFVVAADHTLIGAVECLALLRAKQDQSLSEIMRTDVKPLSARSRLFAVSDMKAWDSFLILPVLSRQHHLVGALRKSTITEKLDKVTSREVVEGQSFISALGSVFIYAGVELVKLLADDRKASRATIDKEST